ncbi:hypothetical protein [Streptosporangium sp. G12]
MDDIVEDTWREFLRVEIGPVSPGEEKTIGEMVADEPDRHDWRVVDAALDRMVCPRCHGVLSRGPVGCGPCDLAHGFRYVAIETDRPGVPRLNEHAVRVNVSVLRRPHAVSGPELLARRLFLPMLLVGVLPRTQGAQNFSAQVKQGAGYREMMPKVLAIMKAANHPC